MTNEFLRNLKTAVYACRVCLQVEGAASEATIARSYGDNLTEKVIAGECFRKQTGNRKLVFNQTIP